MKPWHLAKPWPYLFIAIALPAIVGCRTNPAIPLLERELRVKEDEIYRLRREIDEMQGPCGSSSERYAGESSSSPARRDRDEDRPQRRRAEPDLPPGVGAPSVEMPGQPTDEVPSSLKHGSPLPPRNKPAGDSSSRRSDRNETTEDGPSLDEKPSSLRPAAMTRTTPSLPGASFLPSGDSRRVASIALNRTMTGGLGGDPSAGDQGVLVVVEPRDRSGRTIDAPGEMSIVVVDPAIDGDAGRVARWDFTPAETAAMFRRSGRSEAMHVVATWPNEPPSHGKLHLFIRYVTADGRKLQADQPIEVALASDRRMVHTRPASPRGGNDHSAPSPQSAGIADAPPARRGPRHDDTASNRPVWSPERR